MFVVHSKQVKEPVSLPYLMNQLTEANRQLAQFPDSIKVNLKGQQNPYFNDSHSDLS